MVIKTFNTETPLNSCLGTESSLCMHGHNRICFYNLNPPSRCCLVVDKKRWVLQRHLSVKESLKLDSGIKCLKRKLDELKVISDLSIRWDGFFRIDWYNVFLPLLSLELPSIQEVHVMHREVKMVSFVFIISMTHTTEQNLMEIWRSSIEFLLYFFFGLNYLWHL